MNVASIRQRSAEAACEALGVPRKDWALFTRWASGPVTPEVLDEMNYYTDVMIADRCTHPRDDLLMRLIEMEVDGQALTTDEIQAFVRNLVLSAH